MNRNTRDDLIDFIEAVERMIRLLAPFSGSALQNLTEKSKRLKAQLLADETIVNL